MPVRPEFNASTRKDAGLGTSASGRRANHQSAHPSRMDRNDAVIINHRVIRIVQRPRCQSWQSAGNFPPKSLRSASPSIASRPATLCNISPPARSVTHRHRFVRHVQQLALEECMMVRKKLERLGDGPHLRFSLNLQTALESVHLSSKGHRTSQIEPIQGSHAVRQAAEESCRCFPQ